MANFSVLLVLKMVQNPPNHLLHCQVVSYSCFELKTTTSAGRLFKIYPKNLLSFWVSPSQVLLKLLLANAILVGLCQAKGCASIITIACAQGWSSVSET